MANIDQYIEQIENARYGNEVRQAIVNALTAMNAEISSSGVTSFNERVGNVVSADGDYNISQISATGGMQGQVPVVNNNGGFTMRDMTGEVVALNQLTDVNISSPSDGQVLKYDSTNEEWVNDASSGERQLIASVRGDGQKTIEQLLKDLFEEAYSKEGLTPRRYELLDGYRHYLLRQTYGTNLSYIMFSYVYVDSSAPFTSATIFIGTITYDRGSNTVKYISARSSTNGGGGVTNHADEVISWTGTVFSLYKLT